jgi:hypothetical protein
MGTGSVVLQTALDFFWLMISCSDAHAQIACSLHHVVDLGFDQ